MILVSRKTPQLCYSLSYQEGQDVQESQVDMSLDTKEQNKSQKIFLTFYANEITIIHNVKKTKLYQVATA